MSGEWSVNPAPSIVPNQSRRSRLFGIHIHGRVRAEWTREMRGVTRADWMDKERMGKRQNKRESLEWNPAHLSNHEHGARNARMGRVVGSGGRQWGGLFRKGLET